MRKKSFLYLLKQKSHFYLNIYIYKIVNRIALKLNLKIPTVGNILYAWTDKSPPDA